MFYTSTPATHNLTNEQQRELARWWWDGGLHRDPPPKSGIVLLGSLTMDERRQLAESIGAASRTLDRAAWRWQAKVTLQFYLMASLCPPGRWPECLRPRLESAVSYLKQQRRV